MRDALHEIAALGKLMVLSPHLDDAVFACGELIAATPDTAVVTLFSGAPAAFDTRRRAETKRRAAQSYASRLHALAIPGKPGHTDLYLPERHWRLSFAAETP